MKKMNKSVPGLAQAISANRIGMGISSNPALPPGVGTSGVPSSARMNINGAAENTGGLSPAISSIIKSLGSGAKGRGSIGPRAPEKPSLARSNAISRRLNGKPSRGTELKGL